MPVLCSRCSWSLAPELWNQVATRCPSCGFAVQALVFPAIESNRAGSVPQALAEESEASCFYHPESRAAVPCDECGRFLCHLCDLHIDQKHLCPKCFESGVASNKLEIVETRRVLYDT